MNYFRTLAMVVAIAFSSTVYAQEAQDLKKATEAAELWLSLTDVQQYGASYKGAASAFQKAITQSDWEQALQTTRKPLGSLKTRILKSATFKKDLPGAPPGEYVIIVYDSVFANMPTVIETVTPMREVDGAWKVSGYFIR